MEHRLSNRYAIDLPISIYSGGHFVRGRTCNVSKHGALVEVEPPPPRYQSHIQFELGSGGDESWPRRLRGVVIHREDLKFGVMFLDTWNHAEWQALSRTTRDAERSRDKGSTTD